MDLVSLRFALDFFESELIDLYKATGSTHETERIAIFTWFLIYLLVSYLFIIRPAINA